MAYGRAMKEISEAMRTYLAEIGRRGGASGKGTQWRREACKHAAAVRWRNYYAKKRKEAERREEMAKKAETENSRWNCWRVDSEAVMHDITA